jgi:ABC-type transport system substrate-binding protein
MERPASGARHAALSILVAGGLVAAGALPARADHEPCKKTGGLLNTPFNAPKTADPAVTGIPTEATGPWVMNIFEGLVHVTWDLRYEPGLAEALPQQLDPTTYVFKLRKGVHFHDGTDLTADAVKFALERIVKGEVVSPLRGQWAKWVKGLEILDPHTIKVTLTDVWPDFLWYMATELLIPSPASVRKWGPDFGIKGAEGTGPFKFVSLNPGNRIELVKNKDYWRPGLPCLDRIISTFVPQGSVRLMGLKTGQFDFLATFPESQLPIIDKDPNIIIVEGDASTYTKIMLNTAVAPFTDRRVRHALAYAVDRAEIVRTVYRGRGKVAAGIFPPWHWASVVDEQLDLLRHNPEKAKKLLAEAGYGAGHPLRFTLFTGNAPAHVERGVLLQAQFAQVGAQVEVRNVPDAVLISDAYGKKTPAAMIQWSPGPTVAGYTWDLYSGKSGKNLTGYNQPGGVQNAEVDRLLDEVLRIAERDKAKPILARLNSLILADMPDVPLDYRNHRDAYRTYVKNHHISFVKNRTEFTKVWLDK